MAQFIPVNTIIAFEGKQYKAIRANRSCMYCDIHGKMPCIEFACFHTEREDKKSIVFKEVKRTRGSINDEIEK
ncbi:MAG: hypothetical protein LBI03_01165 [Clostridiales bacterium]|jgi:hypothetical protein|nr:hypothetical protein [Clostridiales bacterium]